MKVLIVDDRMANRRLLRVQLEADGHHVVDAADGMAAMEKLVAEPIDAIISDILMPRMDGYRLCHEVRNDARYRDLPFVFYTATYTSPADEKLARDLGADRYLRKPASAGVILRALTEAAAVPARQQPALQLTESDVLREYSERLVNKLEEKNEELESSKQELQRLLVELRRTQQAAMQQERLHALGQMASGIVHDISNAMSPVVLYVDSVLQQERALSSVGRGQLATVQLAVAGVTETISRLREFCRPSEPPLLLTSVALNSVIEQAIELTRVRWDHTIHKRDANVQLRVDLATQLPDVLGTHHEIRDAVMNLIFNAVDAMPGGGTIVLRTRPSGDPTEGARDSERILVEVSDSGEGMSEETKRRCLEPFFTTKGELGTGLGLAMVFGMAQRHRAEIEIQSELGKGTTVRIWFPVPIAVAHSALERRETEELPITRAAEDA
jgi:signal transduction histidine kinase